MTRKPSDNPSSQRSRKFRLCDDALKLNNSPLMRPFSRHFLLPFRYACASRDLTISNDGVRLLRTKTGLCPINGQSGQSAPLTGEFARALRRLTETLWESLERNQGLFFIARLGKLRAGQRTRRTRSLVLARATCRNEDPLKRRTADCSRQSDAPLGHIRSCAIVEYGIVAHFAVRIPVSLAACVSVADQRTEITW